MYQENRRLFNTFRPHRLFNSSARWNEGREEKREKRKEKGGTLKALHYSRKPFIRPARYAILHCVPRDGEGRIVSAPGRIPGFSRERNVSRWRNRSTLAAWHRGELQHVLATRPSNSTSSKLGHVLRAPTAFEADKSGRVAKNQRRRRTRSCRRVSRSRGHTHTHTHTHQRDLEAFAFSNYAHWNDWFPAARVATYRAKRYPTCFSDDRIARNARPIRRCEKIAEHGNSAGRGFNGWHCSHQFD